ncbi:MAG: PHB depolymerase family esterase [Deltaproteobacteria bacterium]|nr:PHB depolymerase family esterase [Deltaproteobacteria bacterium]
MMRILSRVSGVLIILLLFSSRTAIAQNSLDRELTRSIYVGGLERTYQLHTPSSYDPSRSVPLVILLHGGGGTGQEMEKLTLGGFNRLADREGFVVVYPDGIEKHWHDGRGLEAYRAHRENIDDVGFISALIEQLINSFHVDPNHIYAAGISNGGQFSQRLACELSHRIAAIGVVAIQLPEHLPSSCAPKRPVSVLMMPGTEDPLVPWEGGEIGFRRGRKFGRVLSVPESMRFWTKHNQCPPSPLITYEPDRDPKDGTRVRRETYGPCGHETEVLLYAIEGGGHTWPGGDQYLPARIIGRTSRDIDANEVIWGFFKRHTLR